MQNVDHWEFDVFAFGRVTEGLLVNIPYSWNYWWELNLVVELQIAILAHWWDLNLSVRYRIAIRILYAMKKSPWIFNLVVRRQTAKPPNLIPS